MANQIIYRSWTFSGNQIRDGNPYDEISLPSSALGSSTIQVTVKCADPSIVNFQRNEPLIYRRDGRMPVLYYVQSIQRVGPKLYTISGTSKVGLLEQLPHRGGIYAGQTVAAVVRDICGPLPVYIKSNLSNMKLYGWLPYAKPPNRSARDNLAQVLFAIGAHLGVDQDGTFRVEPLWPGVSSAIPGDRIYNDATVQYNAAVTAVTVTAHQYQQGTEADRTTLFEGTASAGTLVVFDEPMAELQATGFAVQESGANYAVLTAGTGTLTGIPYLHLTNDFTRAIADTPVDNIVTVTDATLVSITNASAVADRMQAYYACTKTISAPIIALTERPGYVINVLDPYDQQMVTATLASADITLSRTLRAEENLLVGFTPPSSGEIVYETKREVLTGGGNWQRPDGVTTVTYILISGAQGGYAGNSGGPGGDYDHFRYSTGGRTEFGYRYGDAGPGGDGGQPGQGGRILQGELDVSDLQTVAYQCGQGGTGAPSGSTGAGSVGSDTTFGPASSAAGATSDDGYTDPITGDTYAVSGRTGIAGGASAGKIPNQSPAADNILQFQPAPSVSARDGTVYNGGNTPSNGDEIATRTAEPNNEVLGVVSAALGSGAAVGSNGTNSTTYGTITTSRRLTATAADGLAGANASPPAKAALTMGGDGGNGGGGGSPAGLCGISYEPDSGISTSIEPGTSGPGGRGSPGGQGGDGIIILYYSVPIIQAAGPLVTKTPKWFNDKFGRRFIV
jgi:hypothetical protein